MPFNRNRRLGFTERKEIWETRHFGSIPDLRLTKASKNIWKKRRNFIILELIVLELRKKIVKALRQYQQGFYKLERDLFKISKLIMIIPMINFLNPAIKFQNYGKRPIWAKSFNFFFFHEKCWPLDPFLIEKYKIKDDLRKLLPFLNFSKDSLHLCAYYTQYINHRLKIISYLTPYTIKRLRSEALLGPGLKRKF